jgi:signal transduction histidine kinase
MATPRPRTIRFHLTALVFAAVIPVLVFGVIAAVLFERQHRASLGQSLQDTARALTVAVDHELIASLSTLQALASSQHLDSGDLRGFYESARRVLGSHQGWRTIHLFDRSGQHLISLVRPFGAPLPSDTPPVVRQTLDTGEPAVSGLFLGTVAGVRTVAATVPVMRGSRLQYVLEAALDLRTLNRLLLEGKLPSDWVATVIDRDGIIVARTRGIEQLLGKPATPEFVAQSRRGEEGSFRDVTTDGVAVYAAYSRSHLSGWTVGLAVPAAVVEGPWRASLWTVAGGGAALLVLAAGLATAFGRRIAGAIGSLSAAPRALGQGHGLSAGHASRIAEVAEVARELTEAARTRADAVAARLRTEQSLQKYAERLRILHEIDRAIIAAVDPESIAEGVLGSLRELLGVPRAIVNLFDLEAGEAEWLAAAGRRRIRHGPGVRFPLTLMGDVEALKRGEMQVIDVDALPSSPEAEALLRSGVHVYMVVPMITAGELIGALSFGGAPGPFPPEQVSIAQEAATQLAIAIAQARLYQRVKRQAEELEQRVRERTAELEAAQGNLIRAERLAILGRLAGGMSHELRNPLGVIKNSVYYLRLVAPEDTRIRKHLDILDREAEVANRIVTGLLDYSRVVPAKRIPMDLNDLVRECLSREAVPPSVHPVLALSPDLPRVAIDRDQVMLVLGNLVKNAIQAMPDGGTLTIKTTVAHGVVTLAVADTGIGIPAEHLEKIWEPLFSTKARGIGFGLAVVRNLAEANGGEAGVESAVGRGSEFTLRFPSLLSAGEPPAAP